LAAASLFFGLQIELIGSNASIYSPLPLHQRHFGFACPICVMCSEPWTFARTRLAAKGTAVQIGNTALLAQDCEQSNQPHINLCDGKTPGIPTTATRLPLLFSWVQRLQTSSVRKRKKKGGGHSYNPDKRHHQKLVTSPQKLVH